MMSDAYSLPARKARICRLAGAFFLILGAMHFVGLGMWLVGPAPHVYCDDTGCRWKSEPLTLLDEEDRAVVAASPGNLRRFLAHVERPDVRVALFGIQQMRAVPFALLILCVGMALRRLGGRAADPLARALPWLRRGSIAAIIWAIFQPLAASLTATVLTSGMPDADYAFYIAADWGEVGTALMLALAAFATVWALEAGVQAQRDLAEIV